MCARPFHLSFTAAPIRLSAAFLCVLLCVSPISGQPPTSRLTSIYPPGGTVGSSVDVTISGTNLDDVDQLIFSQSGIVATPKRLAADEFHPEPRLDHNRFVVQIDESVPLGIYDVRASGRHGTSTPLLFHVDRFRQVNETGGNNELKDSALIELNTTVSGRTESDKIDYFKFHAEAGKQIIVRCLASKIDSSLNPVLTILSSKHQELLRSHDAHDVTLAFTPPYDGEFSLLVHDHTYRGGNEYFYQVSIHNGAEIAFVFPPVAVTGQNSLLKVYGWNLPNGRPSDQFKLAGQPLLWQSVTVRLESDPTRATGGPIVPQSFAESGSTVRLPIREGRSIPFFVGDSSETIVLESELNDAAEAAQPVVVPCHYVGQFFPAGDQDWFEFPASKNETYWLEVISNRWGIPTDPALVVQRVTTDEQGRQQVQAFANADDSANGDGRFREAYPKSFDFRSADPSVRLQSDQDCIFRVRVEDLFGTARNDPRMIYRVAVRRRQPDFHLVAWHQWQSGGNPRQIEPASCVLRQGGTATMSVDIVRKDGFQESVSIIARNLPQGVSCSEVIVNGKQSHGCLVFVAAEDAQPWSGPIQIVGKSQVGDEPIERITRGGTLRNTTGDVHNRRPLARLVEDVMLSVVATERSPALVTIGDGRVWETSIGGKLEIPATLHRADDFKAQLDMTAIDLPGPLRPGNISFKPDNDEVKLAFHIKDPKAPTGEYTFRMRGKTKFKYAANPQAIRRAERHKDHVEQLFSKANNRLTQTASELESAKQSIVRAAQEEGGSDQSTERADAESRLHAAEAAHKAAEERKALVEQKRKAAEDELKKAKEQKGLKDIEAYFDSTSVRLRTVNTPVIIRSSQQAVVLSQSESQLLGFEIERRFDFDGDVAVSLTAPEGIAISSASVIVPSDRTTGHLTISTTPKTSVGEHKCLLKHELKFNGVEIESQQHLLVNVSPPDK